MTARRSRELPRSNESSSQTQPRFLEVDGNVRQLGGSDESAAVLYKGKPLQGRHMGWSAEDARRHVWTEKDVDVMERLRATASRLRRPRGPFKVQPCRRVSEGCPFDPCSFAHDEFELRYFRGFARCVECGPSEARPENWTCSFLHDKELTPLESVERRRERGEYEVESSAKNRMKETAGRSTVSKNDSPSSDDNPSSERTAFELEGPPPSSIRSARSLSPSSPYAPLSVETRGSLDAERPRGDRQVPEPGSKRRRPRDMVPSSDDGVLDMLDTTERKRGTRPMPYAADYVSRLPKNAKTVVDRNIAAGVLSPPVDQSAREAVVESDRKKQARIAVTDLSRAMTLEDWKGLERMWLSQRGVSALAFKIIRDGLLSPNVGLPLADKATMNEILARVPVHSEGDEGWVVRTADYPKCGLMPTGSVGVRSQGECDALKRTAMALLVGIDPFFEEFLPEEEGLEGLVGHGSECFGVVRGSSNGIRRRPNSPAREEDLGTVDPVALDEKSVLRDEVYLKLRHPNISREVKRVTQLSRSSFL
jgi:hypothetical protein